MTAILAILRESWLSLRAEKLFKVVMGLNILVIVGFASMGFDKTGVTILFGLSHIDSEYVYAGSALSRTLYMGIYSAFIVNLWLAWAASILALVSTSSIFPSFLSEGAVELVLSRPTRRSTIFLVKYFGGLLFVMMQVGVFTLGAFFAAGWRVGEWDPAIFLAIPLITLFYSYLFCINVLAGILTRSTLVALLATLLFWFSTFGIRTADDILTTFTMQFESTIERTEKKIVELKSEATTAKADGDEVALEDAEHWLTGPEEELAAATVARDQLAPWKTVIAAVRTITPETARTIGLLHRALERDSEVTLQQLLSGEAFRDDDEPEGDLSDEQVAKQRLVEREESISPWLIIGKSLIFEVIILGIAMAIFRRRDY
jgi:ABC-type transport system involved in multi-copper enzyme maturation permease subunit